ncbi:hypothetical protein EDD86DRAFT_219679 [Gorgonomyces haynaldii]|nr:hypothetical protein EDD86DRAFT_219679 [Gorgonomyces haynaldii]
MTKSQTQREMQLSHLVDEQQKSLQEFESQIAQLKDELSYQKQRIQTLEQLLADKHLELEQLKASQHQIQDTNESLSQEVQVKNQVIQEMMSLQVHLLILGTQICRVRSATSRRDGSHKARASTL